MKLLTLITELLDVVRRSNDLGKSTPATVRIVRRNKHQIATHESIVPVKYILSNPITIVIEESDIDMKPF